VAARIGRAAWPLATLAAAAVAALAWAFQLPQEPSTLLDASYQVVLGRAAHDGLVVGRDLVFTYGPLAWLVFRIQNPVSYPAFVAATVAFSVVTAALWMTLARRSAWPAWSALALFVALVVVLPWPERRIYAFFVLLVAYLYDERGPRHPLLFGAATVLVALLGLAKFTLFALGLGLYLILAASDLARRRLEGLCWLLVLLVTWPLAWLATYGSLDGYLAFVTTSMEVSRGVNAGMQLPGPPLEVLLVVLLAVPSLALTVFAGRRELGTALARLAGLGLLCLVVFKHAFVRHDIHALLAWSTLLALNTTYLVAGTHLRRSRAAALVAMRIGLVAASLAGLAWWSWLPGRWPLEADVRDAVLFLPDELRRAGRFVTGEEPARFEAAWNDAMAAIRAQHPLPDLDGSVDFYGNDQTLAVAYDLDYRPRPVFQGYLATTEPLLALNAGHLASRGADTLVFALPTVDARLPSTIEGPSWPVLLSHYAVERQGDAVLLRRREPPGQVTRTPLGTVQVQVGQAIAVPEVPAGTLVWAEVTLPPSLAGRVIRTLWKAPLVHLTPQLEGHAAPLHAAVPGMMAAGFILSPFVADAADFATLADALGRGAIPLPPVTSFRLDAPSPAQFGPITVVFEAMTITPPGTAAVSGR